MNESESEILGWFRKLVADGDAVPTVSVQYRDPAQASAWLSEANAAVDAVFPPSHAVRRHLANLLASTGAEKGKVLACRTDVFAQALGIARTAVTLLESGRLSGIVDGVRAETVGELLDQAEALAGKNQVVAAAILAGGALETHLLHLCQRNGLTRTGEGSIATYDQAVAQARNAGTVEVYSASDSKAVHSWGGTRNDAAHTPTKFDRTPAEMRLMIEGIRQFIARVP